MALDFDKMTDRERDALVAEKVMGWRREGDWWLDENDQVVALVAFQVDTVFEPFEPNTDIAAAWLVVEKIWQDWPGFDLMSWFGEGGKQTWFCSLGNNNKGDRKVVTVEAKTAQLAICLAALKAAGVTVD